MDENSIKKLIRDTVKQEMSFTARKLTDSPTDDLMVTPRKYVNLNGATSARPVGSVATVGQQYFDTTDGYPIFWNGTNWVSATASIVGS